MNKNFYFRIENLVYLNDQLNNNVHKNNTIEIEWTSGYKTSDFNLHILPVRIQKRCQFLDILELEYLSRGTKKGLIMDCIKNGWF